MTRGACGWPSGASRDDKGLLPPLPRQGRERAAFAITRVLVVDPVVGIDAVERNAITRAQYLHQNPPGCDLRLGGGPGDIGIVAGELHPDRGVLVDLMIGLRIVDVLVVVAVGAVGVRRNEI